MNVRVAIVQPLVPHYRVPVFEGLAHRPGLSLTVVADLETERHGLEGAHHSQTFELRHSPYRRVGPLVRQDGVTEVARDPRFDVVVFEWSSRRYQLPAAVKEARRAGKGVAVWGHGFGKTLPWLGELVRRHVASLADVCILYGHTARDLLVRRGYPADKLFVAPNAIDQSPIREAGESWRSEDRLDVFQREQHVAGVPVLLYISRLDADKRPEMLVESLVRVRAAHPEAVAVFIGDGSERKRLETRAIKLGIPEAVRCVGALYDEMDIAPWALSSVCLVQPEKLGLSIFHGFGYGLPVVTCEDRSQHGPEAEILQHGVNGLVYRHRDINDLTTKILALVEDAALRERLSASAVTAVTGHEGRDLPGIVAGLSDAILAAAERAVVRSSDR